MKRNKKQITKVGIISIAAVLGLLATSIALYAAGDNQTIRVETYQVAAAPTYAVDTDLLDGNGTLAGTDEMELANLNLEVTDIDMAQNEVPEPATMSMLGLGGLALLRRRRNRK